MQKKNSLAWATILTCIITSVSFAQIMNESFAYPDGNLAGNGGWVASSNVGNNPAQVAGGELKLNYTPGFNYESLRKTLGTTQGPGQTFYASYNISNISTTSPNDPVSGFTPVIGGAVSVVSITNVLGNYSLGITSDGSSPLSFPLGLTFGTTYRIVHSYNFNTRQSSLWINPVNESSTNVTQGVFGGGTDRANSAYIFSQSSGQGTSGTVTVDNLCIDATFFGALNCIPEPATCVTLALGLLLTRKVGSRTVR